MSDGDADLHPDKPGQVVLDEALVAVIKRISAEWDLSPYEIVGILHTVAARVAHSSCKHAEDEVG